MIVMIDNYDSFTYNLVQYMGELGHEVKVFRNDEVTVQEINKLQPSGIVISPGPCTPNEAGVSLAVIAEFAAKIPLLGVCLGHQCIGQVFGGKVIRAREIMHGKLSAIYHQGTGMFANMPNPFTATRYHSLVVEKKSLPTCFQITAWTQMEDNSFDEIMGFSHKNFKIEGVQFHPESIMTEQGKLLINNFLSSL